MPSSRTLLRIGLMVTAALAIGYFLRVQPASAGQSTGMRFECGGNNCYGSLRAANLSPTQTDYAQFRLDVGGTLSFEASYASRKYACTFDQAASDRLGPAALGGDYNLYFYILIDGSGRCAAGSYLMQSSSYQALPKP